MSVVCLLALGSLIYDAPKLLDALLKTQCYSHRGMLEKEIVKELAQRRMPVGGMSLIYTLSTTGTDPNTRLVILYYPWDKKYFKESRSIWVITNPKIVALRDCPQSKPLSRAIADIGYIMSRGKWICAKRPYHNNVIQSPSQAPRSKI